MNHTGRSMKEISEDTERDNFMTAEEACAYGLADQVVSKRDLPDADGDEASSGEGDREN